MKNLRILFYTICLLAVFNLHGKNEIQYAQFSTNGKSNNESYAKLHQPKSNETKYNEKIWEKQPDKGYFENNGANSSGTSANSFSTRSTANWDDPNENGSVGLGEGEAKEPPSPMPVPENTNLLMLLALMYIFIFCLKTEIKKEK